MNNLSLIISSLLILFFFSCSYFSKEHDTKEKNEVYEAQVENKNNAKAIENQISDTLLDSLQQFYNLFTGIKKHHPVYDFTYCNIIPYPFACKYLSREKENRYGEVLYSDSLWCINEITSIIYYSTCNAAGYCYRKNILLLNKDGNQINDFIVGGKFGDFEDQEILISRFINPNKLELTKYKYRLSVETLDTLEMTVEMDTIKLFEN